MLYNVVEEGFWVHVLPEGVVALDLDAPTPEYEAGGELRDLFLSKARTLAALTTEEWDLGAWWIIATQSGFHVLFEKPTDAWAEVLLWGTKQWPWKECEGHFSKCLYWGCVTLRVSRKGDREWDLEFLGSPEGAPEHVLAHHRYIQKLKRGLECTGN